MYDSSLFGLLQMLYETLKNEAKFLSNVGNQIEDIRAEINRIQCFLQDADGRKPEYETVRNWIADIREVAYDVENIVEKYADMVGSRKERSIWKENIDLHNIGVETKDVISRIDNIKRCMKTYVDAGIRAICQGESSSLEKSQWLTRSYSHLVDEDFVGLEEELNKLIAELLIENDQVRVVFAICGMGGLGKTTLARKAYRHDEVQSHFQAFAWASISKQWQPRDVLQTILTKLEPENRTRINTMMDTELVKALYRVQQRKKCLIVLDDIWSTNFWNSVKDAFPKGNGSRSKILITTRKKDVCAHIDPTCFLFEPRCLDAEESWKLLHKKAFPRVNTPDLKIDFELETLGKKMASECGGLPLAIIVLAGLLARRPDIDEWRRTYQNLSQRMSGESFEHDEGIHGVLALSYYDLPYQLKPYFLYLGNFPEDQEISARRLYQLWAAEGIISLEGNRGEETAMMEIIGERYLHELAQRYMVQVRLEETTGRIKSCRLHDLMRDTCLSKAKEENFLNTVSPPHLHQSTRRVRRLAITVDDDVQNYFRTDDKSFQHVRSALFFPRQIGRQGTAYPLNTLQGLCNNFAMLRVLHLEKFSFEETLPKAIGNLVHLRYLSLRNSHFQRLPSSVGNLKYLQTLDLRVSFFSYLTLPNTIQKLQNLRNLYLPPSHQNSYNLELSPLSRLETLKNFDSQVSPFRDLFKLTRLQKLGAVLSLEFDEMEEIIAHLTTMERRLTETSFRFYYSFHSEKDLTLLKKLLSCHHLRKLDLIGHISKLPERHFFSQSLTKLTLRRTELKQDPMVTLQKLPKLFSLSLRGNAFTGKAMCCSSEGFPLLKTLKLQGLPNLESWKVETGSMPNLVSLEIEDCKKLESVPDGLRYLTKLRQITIIDMPNTFENGLKEVQAEEESCEVKFRRPFDMKKFPKIKSRMLLSGHTLSALLRTTFCPKTVPKE